MTTTHDTCGIDQSDGTLGLGITLTVLTSVVYIPQWYKTCRWQTHVGLSFPTLWIHLFGNFCLTLSSLIDRWDRIECCQKLTFWDCQAGLLVQDQIGINTAALALTYILALLYFRRDTREDKELFPWVIWGFYSLIGLAIVLGGLMAALISTQGGQSTATQAYGKWGLGIVADIHPIFTWAPQIYLTYKRKSPGSLSVITLFFVSIGAAAVAFNQGFLNGEYLVAVPALIAMIQIVILVVLCLYYMWKANYWTTTFLGNSNQGIVKPAKPYKRLDYQKVETSDSDRLSERSSDVITDSV